MADVWRRKGVDGAADLRSVERLRPTLSWPHLLAMGVGAIVGTGIYTLTGVAADLAGPAAILSFLIAGAVCACAALAYAELSTMIPAAGSTYTYTYAVLGEPLAWIVGWSLILEYTVGCSTVAVGWAAHFVEFLRVAGIDLPPALLAGPAAGGIVNLPAVLISLAAAILLALGTRESARLTIGLVVIKIAALALFIALAAPAFRAANFDPFMPHGFLSHPNGGANYGVMGAAALIFFAFYGFDTVSTAAEEAKKPGRDLTIGIVGSMIVCTALYIGVAACAIGASPVTAFARNAAPLVFVLKAVNHPLAATLVAAAAVVALPSVIIAFMYGQSRIFFVMARDRLLPDILAQISQRTGAPGVIVLVTGAIVATLAGLLPLETIAELANAGTLCAFTAVAICMLVLRRVDPNRARVFRAPIAWIVGPFAIVGCIYLFSSLPMATIARFFAWNAIGLCFYLVYGRRRSRLA